jgi:quercetin dioxygenase-like cupin family protein
VRRLSLSSRTLDAFGSVGVGIAPIARVERPVEGFATHVATFAPGSLLGRHPTGLWQLLGIVSGAGWAEGGDGRRVDLATGDAVLWEPGEEHVSGSATGMVAVIVESTESPV